MLKGEKLSTSVGKAAKTAAVGALAGVVLDNLGDVVLDNFAAAGDAEIEAMMDNIQAANLEDAMADIDPELTALFPELDGASSMSMSGNVNNFYYNYDVVLVGDDLAQFQEYRQSLSNLKTFSDEYYQETAKFHDFMAGVQNDPMQGQYRSALDALSDAREAGGEGGITSDQWDTIIDADNKLGDKLNALSKADDTIAAAVQGGAQQADTLKDKAIKVSKPEEPKQGELDLSQRGDTPVNKNFNKNQKLSAFGKVGDQAESIDMQARFAQFIAEADPAQGELPLNNPNTIGAKLKRGVKKAAGAAAGAVKQGAKDLGNKVTANKLMKAWKAAGSPTDTGSIVNILSGAGLSNDQISSIGQSANVELKPTAANVSAGVDLQSLADEIKKAGVAAQVKQMLMQG